MALLDIQTKCCFTATLKHAGKIFLYKMVARYYTRRL